MQGWLTLQPGVKSLRISSFDKSGGNNDRLEKIAQGERRTLADIKGAGQITAHLGDHRAAAADGLAPRHHPADVLG